jgi:hypothetical protein
MQVNTDDVKISERTSLSVSKYTHAKVTAYMEKRQKDVRYRVTHDVIIDEAIDCLEKHDAHSGNGKK